MAMHSSGGFDGVQGCNGPKQCFNALRRVKAPVEYGAALWRMRGTIKESITVVGPAGKTKPKNIMTMTLHDTPNLDWILLTKRPGNWRKRTEFAQDWHFYLGSRNTAGWLNDWRSHGSTPINVWMGVTCEDQKRANERIPELLKIPAKVRFLSVEPMLEAIHFPLNRGIHWCIVGSESGRNRRPMKAEWASSIRMQCEKSGTKFFMKQMEVNGKVTGDISKFPEDLMIREFPEV